MNKFASKRDYFANAISRLHEAIDEHTRTNSDAVRDGVIQRFEFTTELAWKVLREYMLDQGFINLNSPKSVMKQAFALGIIQNEQAWLEMLNDRNLTSHIYKYELAEEIFNRIVNIYLGQFKTLLDKLKADLNR